MTLPTTPSFRLDGKRALVSGAGRGIGLALASALADAGAVVTLAARTAKEIEAAASEIRKRGGKADAVMLDVLDTGGMRKIIGNMPAFDTFVTNAGTNRPVGFLDVSEDDFDTLADLNVRAAFFAGQAVARGMVAAGIKGSIINISS
ncbi:MAG: SDR family NAD(P)-dependent oxidoreductase, partial [Hyphomicrobiaceae bacterium]